MLSKGGVIKCILDIFVKDKHRWLCYIFMYNVDITSNIAQWTWDVHWRYNIIHSIFRVKPLFFMSSNMVAIFSAVLGKGPQMSPLPSYHVTLIWVSFVLTCLICNFVTLIICAFTLALPLTFLWATRHSERAQVWFTGLSEFLLTILSELRNPGSKRFILDMSQ